MAVLETSRSKIVARLTREGWISERGARHDKFAHPNEPGLKNHGPAP